MRELDLMRVELEPKSSQYGRITYQANASESFSLGSLLLVLREQEFQLMSCPTAIEQGEFQMTASPSCGRLRDQLLDFCSDKYIFTPQKSIA